MKTTWTDAMVLESVAKYQGFAPAAFARAFELAAAGLIDMTGTWKLTDAGRKALASV